MAGKFFGLFPLDGLDAKNPCDIEFKWKSLRSMFSLMFVFTSSLTTILVLKTQIQTGPLTPRNIVGIVFFSICAIICILFFRLSKKFKYFMIHWCKTEKLFLSKDYEVTSGWSLKRKIWTMTAVYLTLSTLEHMMFLSSEIYKIVYEVNVCNHTKDDVVKEFIIKHLSHVVVNIPFSYNHIIGIFIEYLNFSYTFFWNFLDLFIILISIGISFYYRQINKRLENFRHCIVSEEIWSEIREHHVRVTELLQMTNSLMQELIICACFSDGYFILIQMLNITTSLPLVINKIYFWYSFCFLIFKTSTMFLMSSGICEESKKPLDVIRSIPTQGWYSETERMFNQLKDDKNAFSGMDFFFVNRKLLFGLCGSLVTYELVLLQFDTKEIDFEALINCEAK